jgi:hypothetical protein
MSTTPFRPGDIVHAADKNNFGHVIEDDGGPQVQVHFKSPDTGQVAKPWLDRSLLTLASGSGATGSPEERRADIPVQGGPSARDERVGGRQIISPFDAWTISRVLAVDGGLNGELADISAPYRTITQHLASLTLGQRSVAWHGFLCAMPNADAIVRAIADVDPLGSPPEAEPRRRSAHLGDLGRADEESRFSWPGWLVRGHVNLLSSDPKIGKTHLALDLARRIYLAEPWPDGQPPTFPAGTTTHWICGDRHQDELKERAAAFGLPPEAVRLNTLPEEPYGGCDLDNPESVALLREFIESERPGLVIIDTIWRATRRHLSREDEVNLLMDPIISIAQETETTILGLMHLSKDAETLGRRLEGLARSILKMFKPDPGQPDRRKLTCIGNHKEPPPLGVTIRDGGCDFDLNPPEERPRNAGGRPPEGRSKAVQFIREVLGTENDRIGTDLCAEFEKALKVSGKTFWRAVDELRDAGELVTDGGPGTGKQMILHLVIQAAP